MRTLIIITLACLSAGVQAQYNATTSDPDKNWVVTKHYHENGSVRQITKQYYDKAGHVTQLQQRSMTAGQVMAAEVVYDAYGRPAMNTMTAPVNSANFGYKQNFVLNGSGTRYDFQNFDLLKTNNPDAVGGQSVPGTLGWYYGSSNNMESRVPESVFPYTRTDFYKDGSGHAKRVAGMGAAFRMGSGHEVSSYTTTVVSELNHYLQVRNKFFTSAELGAMPSSMWKEASQVVVRDANGKETIQIADKAGNMLLTARPGSGLSIANQASVSGMRYQFTYTPPSGESIRNIKVNAPAGDGAVLISGSTVYTGALNLYSPQPFVWNTIFIGSSQPFTVSFERYNNVGMMVETCTGRLAVPSPTPETYHFKLFSPTTVTLSSSATYGGAFKLYDMNTEQEIVGFTSGTLQPGYYKAVALNGMVTVSYNTSYSDVSYAFYNQLGQLVATIAPEGVKLLAQNLNGYATKADVPFMTLYEYDLRGRNTAIISPESGRTEFIYRTDGNVRFSQNAEQRVNGWFSYTNYDAVGRVIESGEYRPTGDVTFTQLKTSPVIQEDVSATGGLAIATNKHNWSRSTYDVEDNTHGVTGYYPQNFLAGAVSVTENAHCKTWYSYDDQGKIIWIIQGIKDFGSPGVWGYKVTEYFYNYDEQLVKKIYQRDQPDMFVHYYEYDADDRIERVYTNTTDNVGTRQLQARYVYYLHGPLKRLELAGNMQGLDYTYTLHGKLKAVNHPNKIHDPGGDGTNGFLEDGFGMTLEYFDQDYENAGTQIRSISVPVGEGPQQYSGMIRGMAWFSKKPPAFGLSENPTMYAFKYDSKDQYAEATWGIPFFGTTANAFLSQAGVNKETVNSIDQNGNITGLTRTNGIGGVVDNFQYNYVQSPKPTNKLLSIVQQTSGQVYATYQYDNLGRIKAEIPGPAYTPGAPAKYMQYDMEGKVTAVFQDAGLSIPLVKFAYDERGNRIRKMSYNSGTLIGTTYYAYDAGSLQSVYYQPANGSITQKEVPVYAGGERIALYLKSINAYRYELTDHQGNVRTVFFKNSSNNVDYVVSRDYYPYGMPLPGREYTDAEGYRYAYQGQYNEKDPETNWNAYKLRMYDARTGRWMSIDPADQYASPYLGMGNNPVNGTDPDGAFFVIDDFLFGFFKGLLASKTELEKTEGQLSRFQYAMRMGDIYASRMNTIWNSFIITDKEKTTAGQALQIISKFTWELPQQLFGVLYGGLQSLSGNIALIEENYRGALIIHNSRLAEGDAATLGNIITFGPAYNQSGGQYNKFQSYERKDGTFIPLIEHEYGHYLQSRIMGPTYMIGIAFMSAGRAGGSKIGLWNINRYDKFYTESWASKLGYNYFTKKP